VVFVFMNQLFCICADIFTLIYTRVNKLEGLVTVDRSVCFT
jgi:hypothetical protein